MIPHQVLELLAEVGIEAEAGEVAATAAEKASVRFWTSATTQEIEMPLQRKLGAAHRRVDRHLSHRRVPFLPDTSIGTAIGLIRADSAGRYYNAYIRGREG